MDSTLPSSVTLFTDRPSFEHTWRPVLENLGVDVATASPAQLPNSIARDTAVLLDAASELYDEDELLAHLGLARALGACAAVALPDSTDLRAVEDIIDDLCGGLVARTSSDVGRISAVLARRSSSRHRRRFEYLTVSPRGAELLAIMADGNALLVPRPVHGNDDGAEIASIELSEEADRATLTLATGAKFELIADELTLRSDSSSSAGLISGEPSMSLSEIDGARLGARIRTLRLAAGLTQAELARRTGIHRPNIARVEAGRHTPSLETLARLASAIGVSTTRVLAAE